MKKCCIAVIAHVDSGKTTLSEAMLFKAGSLRTLGRVDHKDTFFDTHELERSRGITIYSKQAVFGYLDTKFTLLDTPGHVDFSAETERTLSVLDAAVLLVSGDDGVRGHTLTLFRLLERYGIPTFIFVNKMDRDGVSKADLMKELKEKLSGSCIDFTSRDDVFFENVALCDEELLEEFMEKGTVDDKKLPALVSGRKLFPCYFGSALKVEGVEELLTGLSELLPERTFGNEFKARVFKITRDEKGERLTHLRLFGGSLRVKEFVSTGGEAQEKVNQIRVYSGTKFDLADEVRAGDICCVTGLSATFAGQGLGSLDSVIEPVLSPVLNYGILLPDGVDSVSVFRKLSLLSEEDPMLRIARNEKTGALEASVMGEVQLQVLKQVISSRFSIDVEFGDGTILYRETITGPAEGAGHFEPLRHYAEVHLLLEPLAEGSGMVFETSVSEDDLDRNWQRLILTHLLEKQHVGVLTGSPITDMKITLIAGRAHTKHTEGGDFRQATYRAVRNGLRHADSLLLEPYYDITLEVPADCVGRALSDLDRRFAKFSPPDQRGDMATITGSGPVAALRNYAMEVASYSKGRGSLACIPCGYRPCHNPDEVIASFAYDPDRDLENTADSVFCSGGAGIVIPWDRVSEYMHIDTGLRFDETEESPSYEEQKEPASRTKATDRELEEIFTKTYGEVKRELPSQRKTRNFDEEAVEARRLAHSIEKIRTKKPKETERYLLVDGYNIIFAWDELKTLAAKSFDSARFRLMDILGDYAGYVKAIVILVFDAYKVAGGVTKTEEWNGITVVYTKEAETADTYIEKLSHKLGREHDVTVATSDGMEQVIILGQGCKLMSAPELLREVRSVREQHGASYIDRPSLSGVKLGEFLPKL